MHAETVTLPVFPAFTGRVLAIVPARNEEATIADTIASLYAQSHPVDFVCVVANNCLDETAAVAKAAGAYVINLPNNKHLKAGAINRGLDGLDVYFDDQDAVIIMDADSMLDDHWVENALPELAFSGAVSGAFEAIRLRGVLPLLQRTEFAQARHRVSQRAGNVNVLSGAAAVFTFAKLRQVRDARGTTIPGRFGDWYDTGSLVEDFEITLALKQLGCRPTSPANLRVETDVMRTHTDLWRQRRRWQEGYLRTLATYPLAATWRAWLVQLWVYAVALTTPLTVALTVYAVHVGSWHFNPLWLAVTPLFAVSEMWAARRAGWAGVTLAAAVIPMWAFAMWRNAVYYFAAGRALRSAAHVWH